MNNMGTLLGAFCGSKLGEHLRKKKEEKQIIENQEFRAACKRQMSYEDWKAANKK